MLVECAVSVKSWKSVVCDIWKYVLLLNVMLLFLGRALIVYLVYGLPKCMRA